MAMKAVIIDDEQLSKDLLGMMLAEHCPHVSVVGQAATADDGQKLINDLQPDIVFLDVEMPKANGFDMLRELEPRHPFQLVFVTAYSQYALKALKAGAADYILKPIDVEELKMAVSKVYKNKSQAHLSKDLLEKSLIVNHQRGFKVVQLKNIVRLQADNNYTEIYTDSENRLVASRPIRDFEQKLDITWFYRIHKSHIINLNFFKEYISEDGSDYALMLDGSRVSISRLRVHDFLEHLSRMTIGL